MRYVSTRGGGEPVVFSEALVRGLAPDNGLFVPETWPALNQLEAAPLIDTATRVIAPFLEGDVLKPQLRAILDEAFSFPAPVVALDDRLSLLELFHGPTAAFKDFGARFLAACLARLPRDEARPLQILVATSGDTGGAVAAAFHNRPGVKVTVLYPKGLVSPIQERQLTCWDNNVTTLAVRGTFDDCQRLVKEAFGDDALRQRYDLSSANSINIGRLLPQMTYFAAASAGGESPVNFVIPSGNLGHSTACAWARKIGLPIGEIVLAHNANRTMLDYIETGSWTPRASVATLASAMDVGNPSNAERLRHLFPEISDLRGAVSAYSIDDASIREGILWGWEEFGQMWCPHTAAGAQAYRRHVETNTAPGRWILAATAHPAKFSEIVEPIIGRAVPVPATLQALLSRPVSVREIEPDLRALVSAIV